MKKTRYTLAVLILLNIAAIGAYSFFFVSLRQKSEQVGVATEELQRTSGYETQQRSLKRFLEDVSDDRALLASHFVEINDVVGFIQEVESLADVADLFLEIENVSIEAQQSEMFGDEHIAIIFTTTGSWGETFHFLSLLETMPFSVAFQRVSLVRVVGADDSPSFWRAMITLNTPTRG